MEHDLTLREKLIAATTLVYKHPVLKHTAVYDLSTDEQAALVAMLTAPDLTSATAAIENTIVALILATPVFEQAVADLVRKQIEDIDFETPVQEMLNRVEFEVTSQVESVRIRR